MTPEIAIDATDRKPGPWPEILVFCAALAARLPALGAWWCRDDWGQLARAAGLLPGPSEPVARWLSQHLYWQLTWPLFGLEAAPHAVLRLLLHGAAAVLVVRLGRRCGLGASGVLAAGLVFAASPLSFTPLYWASGIQELLGVVLALLAVERWLAGAVQGRGALATAALATVLSLLAKESGLGLPLLFLAFLWLGVGVRLEDKAFAWALVMVLLAAAVAAGVLVVDHFATGTGEPYDLGGAGVVLVNIGIFGWWLLSPGPLLAGHMAWPMIAGGGVFFALWLVWGTVRWRQGDRLPALAWLAALLALGPALPLRQHVTPYLAYGAAAAWALALASLLPRRLPAPRLVWIGAAVAAAAWGFFGMNVRLDQRDEQGLPADGVVVATSLSWEAAGQLRNLPAHGGTPDVVLLQIPARDESKVEARTFGERWTMRTPLYEALGGPLGPRLILGDQARVGWANGLVSAPDSAFVFAESTTGFRFWGRTGQAALYAALTDVGLGEFERARMHLVRAAQLNGDQVALVYDEGQMLLPLTSVLRNKAAFVDWTLTLLEAGSPPSEVAGLQDMFLNLLAGCSGIPVDELQAGSRRIFPESDDAPATGDG